MRKVCVVIGSRANYSSIKAAMQAIQNHSELELQVVVGASAILDRYGSVVDLIEQDGFTPDARVFMLLEGESPITMAKSTGLGLMELPTVFERLAPDFVVTVGDRFETMATTLASVYINIPLAHTMGGEVSGTIDESIRHAVTKFAHVHFPACNDARERIIRMGEREEDVYLVGCPRMDLVREILEAENGLPCDLFADGVGGAIDPDAPFVIVSQHAVTTEYGEGRAQMMETLIAVSRLGLPAIVLWPNPDAGSGQVAESIRVFREHHDDSQIHFFKNLPIDVYIRLMKRTTCLVGNSSSGIREGAFIGTPVVNIGTRQSNRERGSNVIDVGYTADEVEAGIRQQVDHGPYASEPVYGDGFAGKKIADILASCDVRLQKQITY